MADLPARPSLDHLRREARDLLRAAQSGDTAAADRIRAVSAAPTLAGAQLAVAREYGFASWARLKTAVQARTTDLARQAEMFCEASIRDWTGRAVRMLAATPELASYNFATAVILGDADRVRAEIARDPGLATRVDARTGWTPLHAACASQWNRFDPARAGGLLAVARLLLDAGADPVGRSGGQRGRGGWTPLRCAVAGATNPPVVALLLERGAVPDDHDLYLAGFGGDEHESLRLMLGHAADVAQLAEMALAAPISQNDIEGVRLLLDAGADPRRYADDDGAPASAAYEAVQAGCSAELLDLLIAHGAHISDTDRFLAALQQADQAAVQDQLVRDPGLLDRLTGEQQAAALIRAAETGHTAALAHMLDLGFPVDANGGDDGGTALHAAAYAGSAG